MFINKLLYHMNFRFQKILESICYWTIVFSVAIVSGIRFNIGWDYKAYYETIEFDLMTNIMLNGEYLNIALIEISKYFDEFSIYFIFSSALIQLLIAFVIKKYSVNPWLGLLVFYSFPLFFLNSLSIIRFFIALAITFFAFSFLTNKKYTKYLIAVIIASLFHKSAIIAVIFIVVSRIKLTRIRIIICILFIPVLKAVVVFLVTKFYSGYAIYLEPVSAQQGSKAIIVVFAIILFILIFKEKLEYDDEIIEIANKLFIFGGLWYLMFMEYGVLGHRLSLYGTIFMVLIIPKTLMLFKKQDRPILTIVCVFLFSLMYIYTLMIGSDAYLPFKTIFSHTM